MQAKAILSIHLGARLKEIHAARLAALFAAVGAVFRAGKVQLTALGRALAGTERHGIKRMDRLLGNPALRKDVPSVYQALAQRLLKGCARPVVLVDWTTLGPHLAALVASVPFHGRSLLLYGEVHPVALENNPAVERRFLKALGLVLPNGCRPILVADAGFRVPWLRAVSQRGWDYVVRVRGRALVRVGGLSEWQRLKALYLGATAQPEDLGPCLLTASKAALVRLVRYAAGPYRNRLRKKLPRKGRRVQRHVRSAREPWVLATSLGCSPQGVVELYRCRMQIEEAFRDVKCPRLGWALGYVRTQNPDRAAVLLLIAALAHYAALLIGRVVEQEGHHRAFQANSLRRRRVLSLFTLGCRVLAKGVAPQGLCFYAGAPPLPLLTLG